MDMCFPVYMNKQEKESIKANLDDLIKQVEKGEKKLCKLFKTNTDGRINDSKNKRSAP
jgi:hypothetical protein